MPRFLESYLLSADIHITYIITASDLLVSPTTFMTHAPSEKTSLQEFFFPLLINSLLHVTNGIH